MSSLRLALKQSLQESGGGTFSSGHGDKKKRKKKKNSSSNASVNKKQRDPKRKRGRPRKHSRNEEDDEMTLDSKKTNNNNDEMDEEEDFYSENEFSDSEDYDDTDEDVEDDDDDSVQGPYRSRSREMDPEEEEEDGEMHSDEEKSQKSETKSFAAEKPPTVAEKPETTTNPETKPEVPPSDPTPPNEEDEMMRKKLKLLKLKKKLQNMEKNNDQNSAANKIQTQWKKKKGKTSSPESNEKVATSSSSAEATAETTTSATEAAAATMASASDSVPKEKTPISTENAESTSPTAQTETSAPAKKASAATEPQKPTEKEDKKPVDTGDVKTVSNKEAPSEKTKPSSAAAGDRGSTNDGDEEKPQKKNGYVPAPSREVKQWTANMSIKKSRKYIRIGMRVKVRFAIPVKRDGKTVTKKKFYGGKVTAISKKCNKIRIKYDDGTSEVSKFPDQDVYVDAVDNGEHAVPADRFIPPLQEEEIVEESEEAPAAPAAPAAPVEEQEEGEIPTPKSSTAAPPVVAMETEEGEVEEDPKPKAKPLEAPEAKPIPKPPSDHVTPLSKVETPEAPMDVVPSTPPPASSSATLPKSDTTDAAATSKDDVRMEPAPSPASQEEGELSPGITVSKSTEKIVEKPIESTPFESESMPLVPKELLPSNVGFEKPTEEPIKFGAEEPTLPTKPIDDSGDKSDGASQTDAPSKPKKLSIRIPSNSLATIKSMNTPTGGSKSPLAASAATETPAEVDDVLKDTPETKKEVTQKRKRLPDDVAPVPEEASGQEPPAKRRIKVAIGKNLIDAASTKPDDATPIETAAVEEESSPVAEELVAETKKKKKKGDRAKSPRPKSPLPVPEPEKVKVNLDSVEAPAGAVTPKQQKIGSKGSAFSAKKPKEETIATAQKPTTEELVSIPVSLRTGRKAAEEAKEKLSVKQKAKLTAKEAKLIEKDAALLESGKKSKKKRRREKEEEEHGEQLEEVEQSELEWVQCDNCKKWRVLPDNVKAASLPDLWYCQMNVYDPKRSKCEAPEQNMKQVQRERKKRARKKAKREAELAESQQEKATKGKLVEEEAPPPKKKTKQEKLQSGATTPRSVSPKPGKSAKKESESKKTLAEAKREKLEGGKKSKVAEEAPTTADSGSDTQKEVKKKGKKGKKEAQESTDNHDAEDPKKGGRKRGRPSRNQTTTPVPPTAGEDEDNVEWVQCDKCEKWRKLPPHISADELPDIWNCSMNTWNPCAASCDAAEDKADAHHQEVGATEWQLRQTHAGKYSYRQMIFGTGARKHNRPMSERARAAESLFKQEITAEQPYPTTQYTKSSAFLPRLSNFDKRNAVEENSLGIFDVLRHSNLWEDLRTMDMKPAKVLSTSTSSLNIPGQKLKTYDSLPDEIKHAMQDVVLQTLEFGCLTGDEITGKAQWFPYETSIKGVAGIRGYCNEDIIIHTLLDLVRDGLVEMATVGNPYNPVSQWVPRYRRVGTRRAFEAVEAIKASRCMKISKPWKQRPSKSTTATEWVTGQNVI